MSILLSLESPASAAGKISSPKLRNLKAGPQLCQAPGSALPQSSHISTRMLLACSLHPQNSNFCFLQVATGCYSNRSAPELGGGGRVILASHGQTSEVRSLRYSWVCSLDGLVEGLSLCVLLNTCNTVIYMYGDGGWGRGTGRLKTKIK